MSVPPQTLGVRQTFESFLAAFMQQRGEMFLVSVSSCVILWKGTKVAFRL